MSTNCPATAAGYTYGSANFIASTTDEEGRVTAYVRDARGRPTKITEASGTPQARETNIVWHPTLNVPTSVAQPGLTTSYVFDASGRLTTRTETDTTTQTVPYPTAGQTRTWTYTYSNSGLVATIDGPLPGPGDTVAYTYDANGYVATYTNEVGQVMTVQTVNGRGQPTRVIDPNSQITDISYDARGRIVSTVVDPTGVHAQTLLEYDAIGNPTKVTNPDGAYLAMTYDGSSRVKTVSDNQGQTISYDYDAMGNTTSEEYGDNASVLYFKRQRSFDELGRLLRVVQMGSATWGLGYDKVGNLTSEIDPNGNAATYAYDKLNRLITVTNERNDPTSWTYGGTDDVRTTSDARSIVTSYVRNGWGEIIQEQSNDVGTKIYQRDSAGRTTQMTDARNVVSQYTYDAAGRTTALTYPAEASSNVHYTYDSMVDGNAGVGRLTGVMDAAGTVTRRYDMLGRVTQEIRTIGAATYTVSYTWNAAGRLTSVTYPSGHVVTYGHGTTGKVENINAQASAGSPSIGVAWWIGYTPFGPRRGLLHGNGLNEWNIYDQDERLVAQAVRNEAVNPVDVLLQRGYAYADKRNLTGIADQLDPTKNESYWYTTNGFLQNAEGPWGQITYLIDGVGNITHKISAVGGVTTTDNLTYFANANRLTGVVTGGSTSRQFVSDNAGNIISDTDVVAGVTKTFGFNHPGQLSTVQSGGVLRGSYLYDYLSRMVSRSLPSGAMTLHYVYDLDGNIIAEYDAAGTVLREYIWLQDRPVAAVYDAGTPNPQIYQVHVDHLNRPIMMTDASKAVVWRATYLPFGEVYSITGSLTLDQRFPGQWFQLESGLHYNWHRHYDPTTGRYIQPDPLGMPDGPSRWAYVNNSPLMSVDPTGEFLTPPPGGWRRLFPNLPPFKLPPMSPEFMWPAPPTPNACTAPLGGLPNFGGPLFNEHGGPGPVNAGPEERNPQQDKPLSPGEIKKLKKGGHDPHELKEGFGPPSHSDLYKDKQGNIYVKPKGGKGAGDPTGLNINDF
ncbi:hypothetical protein N185_15835 [Sinorhizobium sp. GW3]|nr:hypothetical protein N185_15835 [Sinorhizobium sp. GW3]